MAFFFFDWPDLKFVPFWGCLQTENLDGKIMKFYKFKRSCLGTNNKVASLINFLTFGNKYDEFAFVSQFIFYHSEHFFFFFEKKIFFVSVKLYTLKFHLLPKSHLPGSNFESKATKHWNRGQNHKFFFLAGGGARFLIS